MDAWNKDNKDLLMHRQKERKQNVGVHWRCVHRTSHRNPDKEYGKQEMKNSIVILIDEEVVEILYYKRTKSLKISKAYMDLNKLRTIESKEALKQTEKLALFEAST